MIKKQGNGTYAVTYSTRDKGGRKVKRKKSNVSSLAMAKRVEADFIAELKNRRNGFEYAGLKFGEFLHRHYLPYCEKSFTDAEYLEKTIRKWSRSLYKMKIDAISPNDVSRILEDASGGLSYATLKKLKSYLSRVFVHACNGGLKQNPCYLAKIPKRKEEVQAKVLTKDETNLLLRKAEELQPVWYRVWAFHLFTGLRSGEGYALLKTDVDIGSRTISVNKSWNSKIGLKCTKTGDWRIVPISKTLEPLIVELLADESNGEYLLPHPWQWKRGDQARILRQFCQGIGITPVKFHDLRATFITHMFAGGASIAEVQSVVGHSDLKTTQVYLRLAGVGVRGSTDKLDFILPSADSGNKVFSLKAKMELVGTQFAANA